MSVLRIKEEPTPPSTIVGMYGHIRGRVDGFVVIDVIGSRLAVQSFGSSRIEFIDLANTPERDISLFRTLAEHAEFEGYLAGRGDRVQRGIANTQRGRRGEPS